MQVIKLFIACFKYIEAAISGAIDFYVSYLSAVI